MQYQDDQPVPALDQIRTSVIDALVRRRGFVAFILFVTVLAALAAAMYWPKVYQSYMTIYVQEQDILGGMGDEAARLSGAKDRALLAKEIIFARTMLRKVLESLGEADDDTDPKTLEGMIEGIASGIEVSQAGRDETNLIRIAYSDSDPQRAFRVTQLLGEHYISESSAAKTRESTSAFQFINSQVREYEDKLKNSDDRLKRFRAANESIAPGAETEIRRRMSALRIDIADIEQQLREAQIRQSSIRSQLSGEADKTERLVRLEEHRARRRALQSRLDALRLTYYENYPDIVNLKAQIAELEELISAEESSGLFPEGGINGQDNTNLMTVSQQLRRDLYETNTLVSTLRSRLRENKLLLAEEEIKAQGIPDAEAQLTELTRDYEVTKGIYEDLLRRREVARVSMNIDKEQKSLSLTIDEPAFFPYHPAGFTFWQIMVAGFVLGLAIPFGLVILQHQVDGKVRATSQLREVGGNLPVLATVPTYKTPGEISRGRVALVFSNGLIMLALAIVVAGIVLNNFEII